MKSFWPSALCLTALGLVGFTSAAVEDRLPSIEDQKIVFQSNRDGNYEIYSMNPDGTRLRRLTDNPAIDRGPALSHDGRKVAFVSDRNGYDNIYVMNTNGSNVVRLTFGIRDENP